MNILLLTLIIAVSIQIILFIPAFIFRTDKLTDLSYGSTFILISLYLLTLNYSISNLILFSMILFWGLRLVIYLFIRINAMKKDSRFDEIREKFIKFLTFWVVQGIIVWVVLIPSILFFNSSSKLNYISIIGILVWLSGLIIEGTADYQKFIFKQKNKKGFIKTGLWKYSRHPNYFGEVLCWLGVFIYTIPGLSNFLYGLISPVFIFILLYFFTGIPTLEKKYNKRYSNNKEYKKYKKTTSKFILLPKF